MKDVLIPETMGETKLVGAGRLTIYFTVSLVSMETYYKPNYSDNSGDEWLIPSSHTYFSQPRLTILNVRLWFLISKMFWFPIFLIILGNLEI